MIEVVDLSGGGAAPANDTGAEDDRVHGLTAHGYIACRGIHVVTNVKKRLGFRVHALTGDTLLDGEAINCGECCAILGLPARPKG